MAAAMAELGKKELKRARRAIFGFIDEASLCSLASIASSRGWTSTYAERWREIKLKVALSFLIKSKLCVTAYAYVYINTKLPLID